MKTTFRELGIPFPLYEAPVEASDDSDYAGEGTCCICGTQHTPCFELGIGTALMVPCPDCATENGLDVSDKASRDCRKCGVPIAFPKNVAVRKQPKVCYRCFRAGKAAITKDTEFGMISWEQAFSGVTHGVPGLRQNEFENVVLDAEEDWVGVRLPPEVMFELLRTPTYGTWQGARWLFCCRYPMTFVGEWHHEQFDDRSLNGNGEQLYYTVVEDVPPETWDVLGQSLCVYVFECKACGKLRAHFDSD